MKHFIPFIGLAMALIFLTGCSTAPWESSTPRRIMLPGFEPQLGYHCESTAIRNALYYQGLPMSEGEISGLGSAPSFHFFAEAPFPWIGLRTMDMLGNFRGATGLKVVEGIPTGHDQAYEEVKALLDKDLPVVLQLDMRYLPYRWGGKYGSKYTSFGAHFITLIGIDEEKAIAYVVDTREEGIKPVEEVSLKDLMKARGSNGGDPALHPHFRYYYFEEPQRIWDREEAFNHSTERLIRGYEEGTLASLKAFPGQLREINSLVKSKYMLQPLFTTFHGWIEDFGTGGSGFRALYLEYLQEVEADEELLAAMEYSKRQWSLLADSFEKIAGEIKEALKKGEEQILFEEAAHKAQQVYEAEVEFYSLLKKRDS